MKFKIIGYIVFLSLISFFQSCATYKTVVPSQQRFIIEQVENLEGEKCVSIPRIYSGVGYSFCIMTNKLRLKSDHSDVASLPFDLVADTAVLPYTICRQIFDGNLVLKKVKPKPSDDLIDDSTGN
ncbi:YceK/YidQ family lipoprotein [Desulforegula conservatrix]|uniref:YceK/YidQ family lipoprotein n=1 Tax=Desulforegula conservatrix TaxID=153026 RepID=UPI000412457D|nr:YceK/YidQ family lipoprotein [Desulforegula conservatrix]